MVNKVMYDIKMEMNSIQRSIMIRAIERVILLYRGDWSVLTEYFFENKMRDNSIPTIKELEQISITRNELSEGKYALLGIPNISQGSFELESQYVSKDAKILSNILADIISQKTKKEDIFSLHMQLDINELNILIKTFEMDIRLHIGELDTLTQICYANNTRKFLFPSDKEIHLLDMLRNLLSNDCFKKELKSKNANFGIQSELISDNVRILYDLKKCICYEKWDIYPNHLLNSIDSYPVRPISEQEIPIVIIEYKNLSKELQNVIKKETDAFLKIVEQKGCNDMLDNIRKLSPGTIKHIVFNKTNKNEDKKDEVKEYYKTISCNHIIFEKEGFILNEMDKLSRYAKLELCQYLLNDELQN